MTITSQENRRSYAGEGLDTFQVDFAVQRSEDLAVSLLSADGTLQRLQLNMEFTVSFAVGSTGCVVQLHTPLGTGQSLLVRREPLMVQETEYVENDAFPAKSHEAALDRLTMIAQSLGEQVGRCLMAPEGRPLGNSSLPESAPGKGLMWNEQGDGLENSETELTRLGRTLCASATDDVPGELDSKIVAGQGVSMVLEAEQGSEGQRLHLRAPTLVSGQDPGHTHSDAHAPGNGRVGVSASDTARGYLEDKLTALPGQSVARGLDASGNQVLELGPRMKTGGGLRVDSGGLYVELSDLGENPGAHTHEWDDMNPEPSIYEGDLDMLTATGPYRVTPIASNLPSTSEGYLFVMGNAQNNAKVCQTFTEIGPQGRTFSRVRESGYWQDWSMVNTSTHAALPAAHLLNRMEFFAFQLHVQNEGGVLQHAFLGHVGSGNPLEYAAPVLQPSMTFVDTPLVDAATGFSGGAGVLAASPRKLLLDLPDVDGISTFGRPSLVARLSVRQCSYLPSGMLPQPFWGYSIADDVAGDVRTRLCVDLRDYAGNTVDWTDMPAGTFVRLVLDGYTTPNNIS